MHSLPQLQQVPLHHLAFVSHYVQTTNISPAKTTIDAAAGCDLPLDPLPVQLPILHLPLPLHLPPRVKHIPQPLQAACLAHTARHQPFLVEMDGKLSVSFGFDAEFKAVLALGSFDVELAVDVKDEVLEEVGEGVGVGGYGLDYVLLVVERVELRLSYAPPLSILIAHCLL